MAKNSNLSGSLFTKQPLTITETSLSSMIAQYLTARRIYNDRLNSGKVEVVKKSVVAGKWKEYRNWLHLCSEGTPDRFAIVDGFIIFIEVKRKGKKATEVQLNKHEQLRGTAKAYVITVDSFDDFQSKFNDVLQSIKEKQTIIANAQTIN